MTDKKFFRVWDVGNKCWFDDPGCIATTGMGEILYREPNYGNWQNAARYGKQFKLFFYTGHFDNQMREIYEGDILYYRPVGTNPHDSFDIDTCWGRPVHLIASNKIFTDSKYPIHDCKIIGNTMENPELIMKNFTE